MAISSTHGSLRPSISNELIQTSLRRQINAELAGIKQAINDFNGGDELSHLISLWHDNFSAAMRLNCTEQETLNTFIPLMQDLLQGREDSQKSVACTATPHDLARYMNGWLKVHNVLLYKEEIKQPVKSQAQLFREQIIQEQKERDQIRQPLKGFEEGLKKIESEFKERTQADLRNFQNEAKKVEETSLQLICEINQNNQAQLAALSKRFDDLSIDIKRTAILTRELHQDIEKVKNGITETHQETAELQQLANEVKLAIEKHNKSDQKKALAKVAITVVGCAVGTFALQGLSSGSAILPMPGGAILKLSIPL